MAAASKPAMTPYREIEVSQFNQSDFLARNASQEAPELAPFFEVLFVFEKVFPVSKSGGTAGLSYCFLNTLSVSPYSPKTCRENLRKTS